MGDTEPLSRVAGVNSDRDFDLEKGHVLDGRYEIKRRIGSGGMGVVYLAQRLVLGDQVALKQLAPISDSAYNRSRFLLEARAAAHIRHPNVVEIFDFGEPEGEAPYIVMEYIEGPTLAQVLRRGELGIARALEVFSPICAAVEAGHRRGIVHRDLKPANIILATSDDGREVVKVLDFGLAFVAAGTSNRLTKPGSIVGTARYMAPEQARSEDVGPATDVFALGILLYEMVTGRPPFAAQTPILTALKISEGDYEPADKVKPGLPDGLVVAIAKALQVDPSDRPASPEQLARLAEAGSRLASPQTTERSTVADPLARDTGRSLDTAVSSPATAETLDLEHFVGREHQLRRLQEEYDKAVTGSGRIVMIQGESGIGKTRLLKEFLGQLAELSQPMILWGSFFQYEGSRPPPLETFFDILRTATDNDDPAIPAREALGLDEGLEAEGGRWRVFTALTEAFAACAGNRPLVLVLDDLHHATAADLQLLDHLYCSLGNRGTYLVAAARESETRPEADTELARWLTRLGPRRALASLDLPPFAAHEIRRWLDRVFGGIRIHPQDLKRLGTATAGNPFYLVEVVRHLLIAGKITKNGGWRCQSLAEVELPDSVISLVRARIDGLDDELRQLLGVAAVIGQELRFETLKLACGLTEDRLEGLIERATRKLLLREEGVSRGNDYRFPTEILRQVLYRDMPRRRRQQAHHRVILALKALYQDDLDRLAAILAYHYHAVDDWSKTLSWGLRALAAALERSDNDAAALIHARAAEATAAASRVPIDEAERFDLLSGRLHRRLGNLEESAVSLLRLASHTKTPSTSLEAHLELARCHLDRGDAEAARIAAEQAQRTAAALEERGTLLEARMLEASCLLRLGRFQEADSRLENLLADVAEDGPMALRSRVHRDRSFALLKLGAFSQAQSHGQQALELARVAGDLLAHYYAISALAAVRGESGDHAGSVPLERQALELARRLSLPRREAIALANLSEHYLELDDPKKALTNLHQALAIFIDIGDRACEGDCRVNLGHAMLKAGDGREALAMLQRGRALCESTCRDEYVGLAWLYEGEAHLSLGDPRGANAAFMQAQEHFANLHSHNLWRADLGRARAERARGRHHRALELAESALYRVSAQRTKLPPEANASGLQRAAQAVQEVLDETKSRS